MPVDDVLLLVCTCRAGQSASSDAAEVSAAKTQDEPQTAHAVHHATVVGARAKVPRTTVFVHCGEGRIFRIPQPY